ncbi:MAG: glycosyltransferase family 39 protein, partial [Tepidisphaeraceae bacterium]
MIPGEQRRDVSLYLLMALCLFSALFGRLCFIGRPFDSDGSMFIYMGRLVSEGGRFCHDLVDNKFPTVGLMTSAPWRAFNAEWPPYVLLGTVLSLTGTLLLARTSRRHFGAYAVVPCVLFSLVYLNFNFAVFGGFQLETLQMFFAILAGCAAIEALRSGDWRDAFVVGSCAGCAAMLKPTGLAVLGAFLVALFFERVAVSTIARQFLAALAGLAVPALVTAAYLIGTDTLADMPGLIRQIAAYSSNSSWEPSDFNKPVTVLAIAGFPLAVRGWVFRRARHCVTASPDRRIFAFVIAWLALETVGVAMQRRMYGYHFLVLTPPLTLLFAMIPRQVRAAQLTAALAPVALFSIYGGSIIVELGYTGLEPTPVSRYIAERADPADAVWRDDAARLWLETGLRPATRFPITFLFANYDQAPLEYSRRMIADFERTRPKFVVLPAELDRMI